MCLLVVAWNVHPRYRLVLAGNRDELHERPTAPLGWWTDTPSIAAGRDLRAGGTWLGASRDGRLGVVTNFRDLAQPPPADAPSRGLLAPRYLSGTEASRAFLSMLHRGAHRYAGFNLLLADPRSLHYLSNRTGDGPRELPPGVYGLSNHALDEPWPKLVRTRERFAAAVADDRLEPGELFDILADRTAATGAIAPDLGLPEDLQRAVSAPFVLNERYGTRCTTLVYVRRDGRTSLHERRFDGSGAQTGASRLGFAGVEDRFDATRPMPRRRDAAVACDTSPE